MNRPSASGLLAASLLALLGAGCGEDRTAGGGSSGSEAGNSLEIQVMRPDGSPAAGILVRLRTSLYLASDSLPLEEGRILDSTLANIRTGPRGSVVVEGLREGAYRIEALEDQEAGQILASVTPEERRRAVVLLGPTGTVSGRILAPRANSWVGVLGTEHRTRVGTDGLFRIAGLPTGNVSLRALDGSEAGFQVVRPRGTVSVGVLRPESPSELYFEDFEDGDTYHRYAAVSGKGWWYAAMANGLTSTPEEISGHPENALVTDSASGNRYLAWSVADPQKVPEAWAEFGVGLGAKSVDLRGLTSIRFRMRGTGTVEVRIRSTHLQSKQFYGAPVVIPSSWTEVSVPLSAFRLVGPVSDTLTTGTLLDSALGLAWSFGPEGRLELDDIRLEGVQATNLWGTLVAP